MKKLTFSLIALLAMSFTIKAQQYVSTEPANRNVILEEFTGRTCTWCPSGHVVANGIASSHPDRFWAVNIHSEGYFSPTSYPNLNTAKGNAIRAAFNCTSFPGGVVNRSTANALGRGEWAGNANTQFNQAAECNVAGVALINSGTRTATINVEVYYTGNSSVNTNYLTVMMLQDSIWGSQTGGSDNPEQWVGNQYCHMHILRDVVTETMGDVISPATQGTLIARTYEYQIPESIGSPNGVDVVLEHVNFIAFVSERYQGTPTRAILNACELETSIGVDVPIYPVLSNVAQVVNAACTHTKAFTYKLTNIGQDAITSVKMNAIVAGETTEVDWTGNLPSGASETLTFELEIPFGTYAGTFNIFEANGEAYEWSAPFTAECIEWSEIEISGDEIEAQICIVQDQYGEQITWNLINLEGDVVASGGPYEHLMTSGVRVHTVNVTLPVDEYLFSIYDAGGNGICCQYGNGLYNIKDADGNYIFQGDGDFGAEARQNFAIRRNDAVGETAATGFNIYPNPANNKIYIDGDGVSAVEVYNSLGQMVTVVEGADKTSVDVASFSNGIYMVRVLTNDGNVTTKKVTIAH